MRSVRRQAVTVIQLWLKQCMSDANSEALECIVYYSKGQVWQSFPREECQRVTFLSKCKCMAFHERKIDRNSHHVLSGQFSSKFPQMSCNCGGHTK